VPQKKKKKDLVNWIWQSFSSVNYLWKANDEPRGIVNIALTPGA
jgi:hypothetical protein